MNQKGLGHTELIIGVLVLASMIFPLSRAYQSMLKDKISLFARADTETQILNLSQHVLKIGRFATANQPCIADMAPPAPDTSILSCSVDFTSPPTGALTRVRFRFRADTVYYETETAPNSGAFVTKLKYTGIIQFQICNDALMANPTNCFAKPDNISATNTDYLASPNRANRFFRYKIAGAVPANQQYGYSRPIEVQSAFYVRNPTPDGSVYQWGTQ